MFYWSYWHTQAEHLYDVPALLLLCLYLWGLLRVPPSGNGLDKALT